MAIRMIVSDLDGTLLSDKDNITQFTKETIISATKAGIHFVVATGRAIDTLPEQIREIPTIEYAVTSNGAVTTRLSDNKIIDTNYIEVKALELIKKELARMDLMVEIFIRGKAYIERKVFENIHNQGLSPTNIAYVLETRTPVDGLFGMFSQYADEIENINICFSNTHKKREVAEIFSKIEDINVTSSMAHNIELIGKHTDKAYATKKLMEHYSIEASELMTFGDNHNDIGMIKMAEIGVAMGNAVDEVKAVADHITESNFEDGVAKAIRRFIEVD